MRRFSICPLCKQKKYFCEKCIECCFQGSYYYDAENSYEVLFRIFNKYFTSYDEYHEINDRNLLDIYYDYEKIINHEIMILDYKLEGLINIIKSYITSRNYMSWILWNHKINNRYYKNCILNFHIYIIPYLSKQYLPLDCCKIIYSYLHNSSVKK